MGRGKRVANGAGYLLWSKFQLITITGQFIGSFFTGPMACEVAITNSELRRNLITPCIKNNAHLLRRHIITFEHSAHSTLTRSSTPALGPGRIPDARQLSPATP